MNGIQIEPIPDDGDSLHLVISAGNSSYAGSVEVFDDPESFRKFGEALKDFPKSQNDEFTYEAGEDNAECWSYVKLRVALVSPTGQAGLFVRMRSNGNPELQAVVEFCIRCEPAALNRLGWRLSTWSKSPVAVLQWDVGA